MENNLFHSIDEINDLNTKDEYQVALDAGLSEEDALKAISYRTRDNARTPFHWDDSENAGFTTGTPWLVINENYKEINAKDQVGRADSVFSFYQELIRLRKNPAYADVIVYGTFVPAFEESDQLFAFYRENEQKKLLVLANYSDRPVTIDIEKEPVNVLINNEENFICEGSEVTLSAYQGLVVEV